MIKVDTRSNSDKHILLRSDQKGEKQDEIHYTLLALGNQPTCVSTNV